MVMRKNDNPERFRNRLEALAWLQSKGQISRGKFYDDCIAGHITIHPDKSVSKFQVAEYAEKVFRFARQDAPIKPPAKANKRPNSPPVGLFEDS
jgi:hypothetical protein